MPITNRIVYDGGIFHKNIVFEFEKTTFKNIVTGSVSSVNHKKSRNTQHIQKICFVLSAGSNSYKFYQKRIPTNSNIKSFFSLKYLISYKFITGEDWDSIYSNWKATKFLLSYK